MAPAIVKLSLNVSRSLFFLCIKYCITTVSRSDDFIWRVIAAKFGALLLCLYSFRVFHRKWSTVEITVVVRCGGFLKFDRNKSRRGTTSFLPKISRIRGSKLPQTLTANGQEIPMCLCVSGMYLPCVFSQNLQLGV